MNIEKIINHSIPKMMMPHSEFLKKFFLILFLSIGLFSIAYADDIATSKHMLENGLTIVTTQLPNSPVVCVYGLVKTGSATEGKFLGSGISHFVEHMVFKSTAKRKVGQIPAQIQAVGGGINASTGKDYTIYTITVPYQSFDLALDVLADMLMGAKMLPGDVAPEREVIFSEMRLYYDNPDRKLGELAYQNVYLEHPYRHSTIGYESLFADISPEDLKEYYRTHYSPNNTIISIAGNIDPTTAFQKTKEVFKDFKRQRDIPRNLVEEPKQITPRRFEEEYATDITRLYMGFGSVRLLDPDLFALDVLAAILGEGHSSRLHQILYEKKRLVHAVDVSNYTPIDPGIFEITMALDENNVDKAVDEVLAEIGRIKKEGIKGEELEKTKRQVVSDYVHSHQTASQITYAQAVDEAFTGDVSFSRKYVDGIQAVTNEDIKGVAKKYLNDESLTVIVLKPKKSEATKESSVTKPVGAIERYVFENGLTVLLREDHAQPLITMNLVLNGGLRAEPEGLNGLSTMFNTMLFKGTKKHSAQDIAKEAESLGIRLDGHSGKNSVGLEFSFLTQDLKTALNLFVDIIKNPTFPDSEIDKLREQMKVAVKTRRDSISAFTGYELKQLLFKRHPYRYDEGGSEESLDSITRDDLVKFYERLFVANNMVLSIFGDIEPDELLKELKSQFGSLAKKDLVAEKLSEDPISAPRYKEVTLERTQAMVMTGFHGVSLYHPDRYGLETLTAILGSSFNGRLFSRIREEFGKAYTLGGDFIPGIDLGYIYFYVLTTPENTTLVQNYLKDEIIKIQNEPVSDQELTDIKTYLKGTFLTSLESNEALSLTSSLDELYGLGYNNYLKYADSIDRVTAADIQRLARQYLDANHTTVVITNPNKTTDKSKKP